MLSNNAIFAKKRLWQDLKELSHEAAQLHTVSALPTANIFEWHGNLRPDVGPFAGTIFHIVLKFQDTYPKTPPEVVLCTSIDHPNVFGGADYSSNEHPYVCLDMLQTWYTNQPYVGWSSAYSVTSILLQLQSFLFAENVPQDYGGYQDANQNIERIAQAVRHAREFSCEILDYNGEAVEHTHEKPWPPLPKYKGKSGLPLAFIYGQAKKAVQNKDSKLVISPWQKQAQQATTKSEVNFVLKNEAFPLLIGSKSHPSGGLTIAVQPPVDVSPTVLTIDNPGEEVQGDFTLIIPSDVYIHLFGFLSPSDIFKARDVCSTWRRAIISYNIFERTQVTCFHTKATLDDESTVLGVGLKVNFFRGPHSPLKEASSPLDILSLEAFEEQGVRTGVWGKEQFDHFLPLIFDQKHAIGAVPVIERSIFEIMKDVPPPPFDPNAACPAQNFKPRMVLQLLSILMNTMVVQLMKDVNKPRNTASTIRRHASEKALEGYCTFHHMLLHFAKRYPSIEAMANRQVDAFLASNYSRHKRQTPNLGALLVCLTLSNKGWGQLWKPFMLENFDRNVRWLLEKHPELGTGTPSDDERIRKTFYGTTTSMRLLMFQVYFMSRIGRPAGTRGPADVLNLYEKRLGCPTTAQKEDLQDACRAILAVDSWTEFCHRCNVPLFTKEKLVPILKQAVVNSRKKRYHFDEGSEASSSTTRQRRYDGR